MKTLRKLLFLGIFMVVVCFCFTGCIRPYDRPEFQKIEPSQSAFLIPLVGDSTNQGAFESEEMLTQNKVATKEVQIPHRWVQLGRMNWVGEWRPSATLIVVERKPVSRSWNSGASSATSENKAIFGETSDAIGIYVGMNCTAMIEEKDAAKFLYRYNNTPLETVIDKDIKKMVEDRFNIETSKYSSTELHANKDAIMTSVKEYVVSYFKDYGITITVLGMKEGISFENPAIQEALDRKFESEQDLVIQQNKNEAELAKVEAEAQAALIKANAEAEALKIKGEAEATYNSDIANSITPELIEFLIANGWDGKLPTIVGGNSTTILPTDIFKDE